MKVKEVLKQRKIILGRFDQYTTGVSSGAIFCHAISQN